MVSAQNPRPLKNTISVGAEVFDCRELPMIPSPFGAHRAPLQISGRGFGVILLLRWGRIAPGQLFHIYLMAYGIFRFFHEFLRDTPQIIGPFSGYQFAALAVAALGATGFILRRSSSDRPIVAD